MQLMRYIDWTGLHDKLSFCLPCADEQLLERVELADFIIILLLIHRSCNLSSPKYLIHIAYALTLYPTLPYTHALHTQLV